VQKLFFCRAHTDFIYANIAEELGSWSHRHSDPLRALRLAWITRGLRSPDPLPSGRLRHHHHPRPASLFNISVVVSLLPTKAFLCRYLLRRTSVFCTLASIGVLLNITGRRTDGKLARTHRCGGTGGTYSGAGRGSRLVDTTRPSALRRHGAGMRAIWFPRQAFLCAWSMSPAQECLLLTAAHAFRPTRAILPATADPRVRPTWSSAWADTPPARRWRRLLCSKFRPWSSNECHAGAGHRLVGSVFKAAAVNFASATKWFRKRRGTGIPVRSSFHPGSVRRAQSSFADFWRSQGARLFNSHLPRYLWSAARSAGLTVLHQSGARHYRDDPGCYAASGADRAVGSAPSLTRCPHALPGQSGQARSGASTVAELAAAGKPALLVPFAAAADDHRGAMPRRW